MTVLSAALGVVTGSVALVSAELLIKPAHETPLLGGNIFLILSSLPVGAFLGLVTASCVSEYRRGDHRAARQIAVAGGASAFIVSVVEGSTVGMICSLCIAFWAVSSWFFQKPQP
jgi:hypothetical protein